MAGSACYIAVHPQVVGNIGPTELIYKLQEQHLKEEMVCESRENLCTQTMYSLFEISNKRRKNDTGRASKSQAGKITLLPFDLLTN